MKGPVLFESLLTLVLPGHQARVLPSIIMKHYPLHPSPPTGLPTALLSALLIVTDTALDDNSLQIRTNLLNGVDHRDVFLGPSLPWHSTCVSELKAVLDT